MILGVIGLKGQCYLFSAILNGGKYHSCITILNHRYNTNNTYYTYCTNYIYNSNNTVLR